MAVVGDVGVVTEVGVVVVVVVGDVDVILSLLVTRVSLAKLIGRRRRCW